MKNYAPNSSRSPVRALLSGSLLRLRMILAAACLGLSANAARAQDQLDVQVRSSLVDTPLAGPFAKSDMQQAPVHGKIYGILAVQPIPSEDKLVKPVDANLLVGLVVNELNTHGFTMVPKGQKPEILITMMYGRGWLTNPYMAGAGKETPDGYGSGGNLGAPQVSITGIPTQNMKEKGNGFESKLQRAEFEKLCIRVTAWKYPTDPKAKPHQLWNTTMIVDDPDHRDLNAVAAKMLEVGAPYFDKDIKEEEIDVVKPLPEGQVNVGTPQVVEPAKPKDK